MSIIKARHNGCKLSTKCYKTQDGGTSFKVIRAKRLAVTLPLTDREVIWNMKSGYGYALRFSAEFIRVLLKRLNPDQKLLLYIPRNDMHARLKGMFPDERLVIKMR